MEVKLIQEWGSNQSYWLEKEINKFIKGKTIKSVNVSICPDKSGYLYYLATILYEEK
jgi:hypothetical protein